MISIKGFRITIKDRDDIPILDDTMTIYPRVVEFEIHNESSVAGVVFQTALTGCVRHFESRGEIQRERVGLNRTQIGFDEDSDYFEFLFNWRELLAKALD
jgi:hypothetical protein